MDSLQSVLEKCKELTITGAKLGAKYSVKAAQFTVHKSKQLYQTQQVQKGMLKLGQFYKDHKQAVMVSSAVLLTYGLASWSNRREISRLKKQAEQKQRENEKKKNPYLGMARTLTEEDNEQELDSFKDDPSTDFIRKSGDQSSFSPPKIMPMEEDYESEDSHEDKIFFQMYQTYLRS